MNIYTRVSYIWDGSKYVVDTLDVIDYNGPVALLCGASSAQNQVQSQQLSAYQTMTQQAQQVFGASSQVFNQLQSTFAPTVKAGPSQQGFSPTEDANLKSQAITSSGQAYKNAKEAVGDTVASEGGGNNAALQSGVNTGINLNVADSAAANTANELQQETEANYATGRQNYDTAVAGLESSPGVFNPATSASSAATGAGEAAGNTANQIASQNNSWVQSVTGALGGIAGTVATGGMNIAAKAASSAIDGSLGGASNNGGGSADNVDVG